MNELLKPNLNEDKFKVEFEKEFAGMSQIDIPHEDLVKARKQLISTLNGDLTINEKKFLLSVKMGDPEWSLIDIAGIDKLPAIQWKLINIKKMPKKKHSEAADELKSVLKL